MKITLADGNQIVDLPVMPHIHNGFMWFDGSVREIREIHQTATGVQIELIPL